MVIFVLSSLTDVKALYPLTPLVIAFLRQTRYRRASEALHAQLVANGLVPTVNVGDSAGSGNPSPSKGAPPTSGSASMTRRKSLGSMTGTAVGTSGTAAAAAAAGGSSSATPGGDGSSSASSSRASSPRAGAGWK